jgi:predicted AAA+ superfamily ATPase
MDSIRSRYLENLVREDLERKMVFIGGPRQVGKTTLARQISGEARVPAYFNWDDRRHRKAILGAEWPPETDLIVFDEIHKSPKWKGMIKGIWDTREHGERIIVTGSSRLDVFRRGGDSLLGRYHYYRLHPFSLCEMNSREPPAPTFTADPPDLVFGKEGADLELLFRMGGFPEPLLSGSERILRRWQRERFERVFREDIREIEGVRALSQIELLAALMPERVASPLSMLALSEDIEVSPKTVKAWIELLCRNYYIFRVPPYHRRLARALKKEAKYYLWDWSEVRDEGARFENLVASHLLKFCHFHSDGHGTRVELHYIRDLEKREVDFLVTWEKRPWFLVECKLGAGGAASSLARFGERLGVPLRTLVTLEGKEDFLDKASRVRRIPASRFLMALV